MKNSNEALKPIEICMGNFIESMGKVEMVMGIMNVEGKTFHIAHTGWNNGLSVLPDDVYYQTYPIALTDEWKECFGIDKFQLPEWIKFVHQVQNYFMWALQINLNEIMDWNLLPSTADIDLG